MASGFVVGYDGSECAKAALARAVDLARVTGDPVTIAFAYHVWAGGGEAGDYRRALREHGEQVTAEGAALAKAAGIQCDVAVLEEQPADALVREAERRDARLIVVGTRGEGRLRSMLVGATPQRLIHQSPIAVLVVPEG